MTNVRFFHSSGNVNVRRVLEAILSHASDRLQAAFCYFTEPGLVLLRPFVRQLNQPESFFIASVNSPTNLNALEKLSQLAPGHVYIHLGSITPSERRVGRGLMHSKLMLATRGDECLLWLGSHNLTGQAIEGGNIEAGIQLNTPVSDPLTVEVIDHLRFCRTTAEPFDPNQMQRYRDIQRENLHLPPWITKEELLVIHAEGATHPSKPGFIAQLRSVPTDFDDYFELDREIRLYVYPSNSLLPGMPVNPSLASLWKGRITGLVRTDLHPSNGGTSAQFRNADFDLDVSDIFSPPILLPGGKSTVNPASQVILFLAAAGKIGEELYSIDSSVVDRVPDSGNKTIERRELDADMKRFFTPESVEGDVLVHRPLQDIKARIKVAGYEETLRLRDEPAVGGSEDRYIIDFETREKVRDIDAFLFLTTHVIRSPHS